MSEELKPCMGCGSENVYTDMSADCTGTPMAGCLDCGLHLTANSIPAAIAAWNTRTPPKVRALEFVKNKAGSFDSVQWCYWIAQNDGDEAASWAWGYAGDVLGDAPNLPSATEAVQAEHNRRVLACLEGYDD